MTLQQFIEKYDGKLLEVSGSSQALYQCVDLANGYIKEVLSEEPVLWCDAKNFWTRASSVFERIKPVTFPKAGDIVIWNLGEWGHIAVATGVVRGDKFQVFSQNDPLKSPCHLKDYPLKNLIGYLRKDMMPTKEDIIWLFETYAGFTPDQSKVEAFSGLTVEQILRILAKANLDDKLVVEKEVARLKEVVKSSESVAKQWFKNWINS